MQGKRLEAADQAAKLMSCEWEHIVCFSATQIKSYSSCFYVKLSCFLREKHPSTEARYSLKADSSKIWILIIYSRSQDHEWRAVSFRSPLPNIHHSLSLQSSQTHWLAGVLSPGIDSACETQIRRPRCGKKFSSSTHCPTVTAHNCTFKQFHVNQWVITGGISERASGGRSSLYNALLSQCDLRQSIAPCCVQMTWY